MKYYEKFPYDESVKEDFDYKEKQNYFSIREELSSNNTNQFKVIERWYKDKIDSIVYRVNNPNIEQLIEQLLRFHEKNYNLESFQIEKKITTRNFLYSNYHENELVNFDFINLNENMKSLQSNPKHIVLNSEYNFNQNLKHSNQNLEQLLSTHNQILIVFEFE